MHNDVTDWILNSVRRYDTVNGEPEYFRLDRLSTGEFCYRDLKTGAYLDIVKRSLGMLRDA
jgi:hypothetical protein